MQGRFSLCLMNNLKIRFLLGAGIFLFFEIQNAYAQVTTAQIQGIVLDNQQKPLMGASVVALHQPTGTTNGTITLESGRFTIPNLRVGGPYQIEVSYIGFANQEYNEIYLVLGDKLEMNFQLSEQSDELQEVKLVSSYDENLTVKNKTGASTQVSRRQLTSLPTITRSASDYTRLEPSSNGNSFAGRNNRFNNFSLDGSLFNNPYGLDSAVPGGQSSAQPVSLDAIDQIQINIAPYDVTLAGFTGASVNAVTKSGTNELKGSAFSFFRNQDFTGIKVRDEKVFRSDLTHLQTGFILGGPIINNKLFLFSNLEIERRSDIGSDIVASRPGLSGEGVSRVEASDLDLVSQTLFSRFGYKTGPYEKYTHRTDNIKGLLKLDWNINSVHSLVATYNFLDASKELPRHPRAGGRGGPDQITLQFYNSGYQINNVLHAGIIELKSNFSNKFSNNLQLGFTSFNDYRLPFSEPFPIVNINKNNIRYIIGGHEPFSIQNYIKQQVFQLTNNFNIYLPNHQVTIGSSLELFRFENSFNLGWYDPQNLSPPYPSGTYGPGFESVKAFVDFVDAGFMDPAVNFAQQVDSQGNWKVYFIEVGQWASYIQDLWQLNQNLVLTIGLRMDIPFYGNSKRYTQEIIDTAPGDYDASIAYFERDGSRIKFDNTQFPRNRPLFSPRFGFNWKTNDKGTSVLRGGAGIFSGRIPFVWIGNQIGNPFWYFRQAIHPEFKFPQILRTNVGHDYLWGKGWSTSTDILYSKDINGMLVRNYGLNKPTGKLKGVDNRLIYTRSDIALYGPVGSQSLANIYVFTNTDIGWSLNGSVKIQKFWNRNSSFSLSYNYLISKDVNSASSEITSSAFNNNPALGDVNQGIISNSLFGNKHRILGTINREISYGLWTTSLGLFFEYVQGGRFGYTYGGDINGDGASSNDLIYIPTKKDLEMMQFEGTESEQSEQRKALDYFIQQNPILKNNRGEYSQKYVGLLPWTSRWDVRLVQKYNIKKDQSIQFSVDILNMGNLISSQWGIRQRSANSQPISVNVDMGEPTYSFDKDLQSTFADNFSLQSRWQIQFGLRYSF